MEIEIRVYEMEENFYRIKSCASANITRTTIYFKKFERLPIFAFDLKLKRTSFCMIIHMKINLYYGVHKIYTHVAYLGCKLG